MNKHKKSLSVALAVLLPALVLGLVSCANKKSSGSLEPSSSSAAPSITVSSIAVDASSTMKKSFAKGLAFSSEGLIVKAAYSDGSSGTLDAAKYAIDSSAYDKTALGEYEIKISLTADAAVKTSYKVTVTAAEIISLALDKASTARTSFVKTEAFSSEGLKVNKVYTDETAVALADAEFTIDSTAYQASVAGTYKIALALVADTSKKGSYEVAVGEYPFVGDYYMRPTWTENDQFAYFNYRIAADGTLYYNDGSGEGYVQDGDPLVMSRASSSILTLAYGTDVYTYDEAAGTLVDGTDTYKLFDSSKNVWLTTSDDGSTISFVVSKGGTLSKEILDTAAENSEYYHTALPATKENIVTTATVFTESMRLYKVTDYTGKSFIGKFYNGDHNKVALELFADATLVNYTQATPEKVSYEFRDGSTLEIVFKVAGVEVTVVFAYGNTITGKVNGTEAQTYTKASDDDFIVTLKDGASIDAAYAGKFSGLYVVYGGGPFDLLFSDPLACLTLEGYSEGTAITADVTYEITGVTTSSYSLNSTDVFGSYLTGCFTFDVAKKHCTYVKGATTKYVAYNFIYIDLTASSLSVEFTMNNSTVRAVVGSASLVVSSGDFAGTYAARSYLAGLPFITNFASSDGSSTIYVDSSGSVDFFLNGGLSSGYLRVNGVTSGKYYFLCTISGIEKSLAIDTTASPMSLTYDEATYLAPKYLGQPFVGDFILNGASIVISEDGSVTIPGLSKGTISYFSEASGVYTIVTTKATITYTKSTDSVSYDGNVYARSVDMDVSKLTYNYTSGVYSSGDNTWTFSGSGYVYQGSSGVNPACTGHADQFVDASFRFTPIGGEAVTIAVANDGATVSFSYGELTYSKAIS